MSLSALQWSFDQELFSSSHKFVLVALANYANDTGKAYPSVATICQLTCQNDKTVRRALAALVEMGFLTDTGKKFGDTQQVKVYQFPAPAWQRPPKTVVFEKEKTPERLPNLGSNPMNHDPLTIKEELPLRGVNGKKPAAHPTEVEVVAYCNELGLPDNDGHFFFNKWLGNGWTNAGKPVKDWKAVIRQWKAGGWLPSQKVNHRNPTGSCL